MATPSLTILDLGIEAIPDIHLVNATNPQLCFTLQRNFQTSEQRPYVVIDGIEYVSLLVETIESVEEEVLSPNQLDGLDAEILTGASESALKKLEMERFDDGQLASETCAICLEEFGSCKGEKNLTRMPCSHVFHYHCVLRWMKNRNSCPMCRCNINGEYPS